MGQGPLRDELEQTARAGGYLKQVRFAGFRRDACDVMNAIDVMALPSHREPCALAYIEAALLAKPIVACRAGGAPESIADGETGILAPVGDSRAIGEAILALLENRDFAAQHGRKQATSGPARSSRGRDLSRRWKACGSACCRSRGATPRRSG